MLRTGHGLASTNRTPATTYRRSTAIIACVDRIQVGDFCGYFFLFFLISWNFLEFLEFLFNSEEKLNQKLDFLVHSNDRGPARGVRRLSTVPVPVLQKPTNSVANMAAREKRCDSAAWLSVTCKRYDRHVQASDELDELQRYDRIPGARPIFSSDHRTNATQR